MGTSVVVLWGGKLEAIGWNVWVRPATIPLKPLPVYDRRTTLFE